MHVYGYWQSSLQSCNIHPHRPWCLASGLKPDKLEVLQSRDNLPANSRERFMLEEWLTPFAVLVIRLRCASDLAEAAGRSQASDLICSIYLDFHFTLVLLYVVSGIATFIFHYPLLFDTIQYLPSKLWSLLPLSCTLLTCLHELQQHAVSRRCVQAAREAFLAWTGTFALCKMGVCTTSFFKSIRLSSVLA